MPGQPGGANQPDEVVEQHFFASYDAQERRHSLVTAENR